MPLASRSYSYPLLGAFWTIFIIFLWVIWIWTLIWVFIDIFRSQDLSGWAKALWFLFVLLIPLIGVVVYLIARGGSMNERARSRPNSRTRSSAATSSRPRRTHRPTRRTSYQACLPPRPGSYFGQEFERQKAKVLAA